MNRDWMKRLSAPLLIALGAVASGPAVAATLNDIYRVAEQINAQARQSQARIDTLTEETRSLLNDYKTVLKEVEGLQVYNNQLQRQIGSQEREMTQLASSIEEVTVIERQIGPLMIRMIDGLEQFIELDLPFLRAERENRIASLRDTMDRADVLVSEKFSQVFRAFQIENEYGRTMEAYGDTVVIDGVERKVDVLKVGRVALVYQTPDGAETGMFNPVTRQWERLSDSYKTPIRNGIRMANQQLSPDLLILPINGAEAVQ
jgi:predicted RNase H-like nuclease (RuvC/YqgF family)